MSWNSPKCHSRKNLNCQAHQDMKLNARLLTNSNIKHTVQGKSWDHCCACAAGASSDSVFPSMIAHCRAMVSVSAVNLRWPPPTSDFFQSKTSTCQGSRLHWPPSPGFPGPATLAHGPHRTVGTPQNPHWRPPPVRHCTLRLPHPSAGGNTRRPEMARPTRHAGAGLRGPLGPTAHGLLGRQHPGPRLSHTAG